MQHIQYTIDLRFSLMTIRPNQRDKSLSSEISLNDSFIQVFNHLVVERVKWFEGRCDEMKQVFIE